MDLNCGHSALNLDAGETIARRNISGLPYEASTHIPSVASEASQRGVYFLKTLKHKGE